MSEWVSRSARELTHYSTQSRKRSTTWFSIFLLTLQLYTKGEMSPSVWELSIIALQSKVLLWMTDIFKPPPPSRLLMDSGSCGWQHSFNEHFHLCLLSIFFFRHGRSGWPFLTASRVRWRKTEAWCLPLPKITKVDVVVETALYPGSAFNRELSSWNYGGTQLPPISLPPPCFRLAASNLLKKRKM